MPDDWPYDVQLEWDSFPKLWRVLKPVSFAGLSGGWGNMTIDLAVGNQRQTYLVVCGDCGGHFVFDNYWSMKEHDAEPEASCMACHSKRVRLYKADKNTVMEVVCRGCGFIFLSKPQEISGVPVSGTPVFPNCPKCGKPDVYAMVPRERVGYDAPDDSPEVSEKDLPEWAVQKLRIYAGRRYAYRPFNLFAECTTCNFRFLNPGVKIEDPVADMAPLGAIYKYSFCPRCGASGFSRVRGSEEEYPRIGYESPRHGCWNPLGFIEER